MNYHVPEYLVTDNRRPRTTAYKRRGIPAWLVLVFSLIAVMLLLAPLLLADIGDRVRYVDGLIEQMDTEIPKDVIRAIAWAESEMQQYRPNGKTYIGKTGDVGIMQISLDTVRRHYKGVNIKRLYTDTNYNLCVGVMILEDKLEWVENKKLTLDWTATKRKYNLWGHTDLEIAIRFYNSLNADRKYLNWYYQCYDLKPWEKYLGEERK